MKKSILLLLLLIPLLCVSCDFDNTQGKSCKVSFVNWNPFPIYLKIDNDNTVHKIWSESKLTVEGSFFGKHTLCLSINGSNFKKHTININSNVRVAEYAIFYIQNEADFHIRETE